MQSLRVRRLVAISALLFTSPTGHLADGRPTFPYRIVYAVKTGSMAIIRPTKAKSG